MITDLERLKDWMKYEEMSAARLSRLLKFTQSAMSLVLNDKRPISGAFKYRFVRRFGIDTYNGIFQEPFYVVRRPTHHNSERLKHPEKYAAHQAVAVAILRGQLRTAKEHKCHGCDKQARDWHHPSYHPNDHLNVIPLCRSCHYYADRGKLDIPFGVVPTQVGLVRIAIATIP